MVQLQLHCVSGGAAGAGAGAGDNYPESTDAMLGLSLRPELGQEVVRPEGGAVASLEGTRPLEVKAAGQPLEEPGLQGKTTGL